MFLSGIRNCIKIVFHINLENGFPTTSSYCRAHLCSSLFLDTGTSLAPSLVEFSRMKQISLEGCWIILEGWMVGGLKFFKETQLPSHRMFDGVRFSGNSEHETVNLLNLIGVNIKV
ncbi:hypothetical protein CDAR_395441 [Caerostris darwini]|uniref:Uncharacterized protein n=1 Tax=Caerostris darwini TaxID=1538125 RepID=A0AAV4RTV4_9ARAC|nr:hypothetical protein CDAR_395441 [Caerostris darwini]